MLIALIVVCEIGFWVMLALGMLVRYLLHMPRLGKLLLLCVPLLDFILFVAASVDLHKGAEAELAHALSGLYLGLSLVYGHSGIRWIDNYAAYRFAGGPKPLTPPKHGRLRTIYEWTQWIKGCLAAAITAIFLYGAVLFVGQADKTHVLTDFISAIPWVMVGWLIFWPVWYTIREERAP